MKSTICETKVVLAIDISLCAVEIVFLLSERGVVWEGETIILLEVFLSDYSEGQS